MTFHLPPSIYLHLPSMAFHRLPAWRGRIDFPSTTVHLSSSTLHGLPSPARLAGSAGARRGAERPWATHNNLPSSARGILSLAFHLPSITSNNLQLPIHHLLQSPIYPQSPFTVLHLPSTTFHSPQPPLHHLSKSSISPPPPIRVLHLPFSTTFKSPPPPLNHLSQSSTSPPPPSSIAFR